MLPSESRTEGFVALAGVDKAVDAKADSAVALGVPERNMPKHIELVFGAIYKSRVSDEWYHEAFNAAVVRVDGADLVAGNGDVSGDQLRVTPIYRETI